MTEFFVYVFFCVINLSWFLSHGFSVCGRIYSWWIKTVYIIIIIVFNIIIIIMIINIIIISSNIFEIDIIIIM